MAQARYQFISVDAGVVPGVIMFDEFSIQTEENDQLALNIVDAINSITDMGVQVVNKRTENLTVLYPPTP